MMNVTNEHAKKAEQHFPTHSQEREEKAAQGGEEGSATVEYAIGVVVAATFAGLLLAIVRSDAVRQGLESIIEQALNVV